MVFFSLNIMLGHLNASMSSQAIWMKPEGGLFQQPPELCLCFLPLHSGSTLPQPHNVPERCGYSAHPVSLFLCVHQPQPQPVLLERVQVHGPAFQWPQSALSLPCVLLMSSSTSEGITFTLAVLTFLFHTEYLTFCLNVTSSGAVPQPHLYPRQG